RPHRSGDGKAKRSRGRSTPEPKSSSRRSCSSAPDPSGGAIVERGNHETLYALGRRYFEMYTRQHGLESNLFLAPGEGEAAEKEPADGGQADARRPAPFASLIGRE